MTLQIAPASEGFPLPNTGHVIFEGDSSRKKLLIVFAYINQPLDIRSHYNFLRHIDCKKLFLNPGTNQWYQTGVPGVADTYSGLVRFLQDVASDFADHEILCLGHSMGGFAALGLGVSIGASRILVSVPEFVLNTPKSLSIRHLKETTVECGDLSGVLANNPKSEITILVGRQDAFDLGVSRQLGEFPHTEVIELDSGHAATAHLKDMGTLTATLKAFIEGRPIRPAVEGA